MIRVLGLALQSASVWSECFVSMDSACAGQDCACPSHCRHVAACANSVDMLHALKKRINEHPPPDGSFHDYLLNSDRSSCHNASTCSLILPRGQAVTDAVTGFDFCIPCLIDGCEKCGLQGDSMEKRSIVCESCTGHFEEQGGACVPITDGWSIGLTVFSIILATIVVWAVIDIIRAECSPVLNKHALNRGFTTRAKAKFFDSAKASPGTNSDAVKYQRYSLCASLLGPSARDVGGPGLVLFFNWFPFVMVLSIYNMIGAALYAPDHSRAEEFQQLDFCWQPQVALRLADRPGHLQWAAWSYFGSAILLFCFLWYQNWLWVRMDHNDVTPSLKEYCVQLKHLPPDMVDANEVEAHLQRELKRLMLDSTGIVFVSIAHAVPKEQREEVEQLLERHLRDEEDKQMKRAVQARPAVAVEEVDVAKAWAGPPLVRIFGAIFHQLPIFSSDPKEPAKPGRDEKAAKMLHDLKSSGTAFVVLQNEALVGALVNIGRLQFGEHKVRCKACDVEPLGIRWLEYMQRRPGKRLQDIVVATVVLLLAVAVWLLLFAIVFNFHLATHGDPLLPIVIGSMFLPILVPLGNAMLGGVIGGLTESLDLKTMGSKRLVELVLNYAVCILAMNFEFEIAKIKLSGGFHEQGFFLTDFILVLVKTFREVAERLHSPSEADYQSTVQMMIYPVAFITPIFGVSFATNMLPIVIGHWRIKGDPRVRAGKAESMFRPCDVDTTLPYIFMLLWLSSVMILFWISPGRYILLLWSGICIWGVLMSVMCRLDVLRYQAQTNFNSNKSHEAAALLLALPLGFLCARFISELGTSTSSSAPSFITGLLAHIGIHFIFVMWILPKMIPKPTSRGKKYAELVKEMEHSHTLMADFLNTNPIEVLKRMHTKEESDAPDGDSSMIYFRLDKWYLQHSLLAADHFAHSVGQTDFDEHSVRITGERSLFAQWCLDITGEIKELLGLKDPQNIYMHPVGAVHHAIKDLEGLEKKALKKTIAGMEDLTGIHSSHQPAEPPPPSGQEALSTAAPTAQGLPSDALAASAGPDAPVMEEDRSPPPAREIFTVDQVDKI